MKKYKVFVVFVLYRFLASESFEMLETCGSGKFL